MGIIRDYNNWGKHPLSTYGEIIDYDGIRRGTKSAKFRPAANKEEAQEKLRRQEERYQRHLELKKKKEEERAEQKAGLIIVTSLIYVLSRLLSGKSEEIVHEHHYPDKFEGRYFAQQGKWTTTVYAAGFVLQGRKHHGKA
tara:strand:+ start:626 stop:1045 length:420 start_codon:yes stop_codon:yes gene_type:complete